MNEYVFMAIRNLKARKVRNHLTLLGIIIGVTSLISLITLGEGLENGIGQTLDKLGPRRIFIGPKIINNIGSTQPSGISVLSEKDSETISQISSIEYVNSIIVENLKVEFGREERFKAVQGISVKDLDKLFEEMDIGFSEGRLLQEGDTYSIIIGSGIAKEYFDNEVRLQNSLYLNGIKFKVIGITEPQGSQDLDYRFAIPLDKMQELLNAEDAVSAITAVAKPGQDVDFVSEKVEKTLKRKRGDENFQVTNPKKVQEQARELFSVVKMVVAGIAFISLIVGAIGIMNSMYTAVLERQKEIGIMKAIGATNHAILQMFLLESAFLGFVGGIIGISLGLIIAIGMMMLINLAGIVHLVVSVNWILILFGLIFSVGLGVVAGILPAMGAARLPPVEALRYE